MYKRQGQDTLMETLNASIEFDQRLATQDIDGSIAHALMLGQTGIITEHDSQLIVKGLEEIRIEIENNQFIFKKSLETKKDLYIVMVTFKNLIRWLPHGIVLFSHTG